MEEPTKSIDLLGLKPFADSVHTLTKGTVDGASAFLSRICLPAAEELGLLLRDRVGAWRGANALKITQRAEQMVEASNQLEPKHAHPRLVASVIELGSWSDSDEVCEMWAGLLASSCTDDGRDDSNLMFIDLLSRLSLSQARLLEHSCKCCSKFVTPARWIMAKDLQMSLEEIQKVSGISDFHRLDREIDHMRTLGLLDFDSGFNPNTTTAGATASPLALQMYARCHGHSGDIISFYGLEFPTSSATEQA